MPPAQAPVMPQMPVEMPPMMTSTPPVMQAPVMQQAVVGPNYAGFWVRFGAVIIDAFVIGLIIQLPLNLLLSDATAKQLILGLVGLIYETLMVSSKWQGTLGKMALHLKVTDLNGNRLTLNRSVGRYLAKILSAITICIGYIMIAFTKKKQGLHDILAKTLVLRS